MTAVFLFHRDLRLVDNSALALAIKRGVSKIIPLFVLNPDQIDESKNPYFSHPSVQFMCESLAEVDSALRKRDSRLHIFHGDTVKVLDALYSANKFNYLYCNRDFTVYAHERDSKIKAWCKSNSVEYIDAEDYDIVPADRVLMNEGTPQARPYTVLSHYFNKFVKDAYSDKNLVRKPEPGPPEKSGLFVSSIVSPKQFSEVAVSDLHKFYKKNEHAILRGGRSNGMKALDRVPAVYKRYSVDRHLPGKSEGTVRISAHLKFGTVSIREFFWKILSDCSGGNIQNDLVREIVFRSFYYKIWTHQPKLQRDKSFHQHVDDEIPWKYPKDAPDQWKAWMTGTTGFPMADAGMRQLMHENYVHGRARMVLATVATRYLLFDWRECMRVFGQHLTDYDPILNSAGWGFGCSLGENAQNIWRAPMNPFLQSKNYDPECEYIKRWIPELKNVTAKDIHDWSKKTKAKYPNVAYPAPIVDQKEVSNRATALWKDAARKNDPKN